VTLDGSVEPVVRFTMLLPAVAVAVAVDVVVIVGSDATATAEENPGTAKNKAAISIPINAVLLMMFIL
jgi:hypothetical protein